jgi:hypothetical protein
MTVAEAFGDVAGLLAKMDPAKIVGLHPSQAMTRRVAPGEGQNCQIKW